MINIIYIRLRHSYVEINLINLLKHVRTLLRVFLWCKTAMCPKTLPLVYSTRTAKQNVKYIYCKLLLLKFVFYSLKSIIQRRIRSICSCVHTRTTRRSLELGSVLHITTIHTLLKHFGNDVKISYNDLMTSANIPWSTSLINTWTLIFKSGANDNDSLWNRSSVLFCL